MEAPATLAALRAVDGLLRRLAYRFAMPNAPVDDLWQEARIAFVVSLPRYDAGRGKLTTWAYEQGRGAILKYLRDKALLIRIPAYVWEAGEAQDLVQAEDTFESREPGYDPWREIDSRLYVESLLAQLSPRQQFVLRQKLQCREDAETAARLGISAQYVRHLRRKALRAVKKAMAA